MAKRKLEPEGPQPEWDSEQEYWITQLLAWPNGFQLVWTTKEATPRNHISWTYRQNYHHMGTQHYLKALRAYGFETLRRNGGFWVQEQQTGSFVKLL